MKAQGIKSTTWILAGILCLTLNSINAFPQDQTWENYMDAAKSSFTQGDYDKAEELLTAALNKTKKFKNTDRRLLITYRNFALLYQNQKKFAQAEAFYDKVLVLKKRTAAPNDPSIARDLNNLATILVAQGKYSEAKEIIKKALIINKQALGKEHPSVATNLANLASIYHMEGNFAEAEALYLHALAIREKGLGPNHPQVALILTNLAQLYCSQGEDIKAEPILQRAAAITQQKYTSLAPKKKPPEKMRKTSDLNTLDENGQILEESPAESEPTKPLQGPFYANRRGVCYHRRSCRWVKNTPLIRLQKFMSAEEAQNAGYQPCHHCNVPEKN